MKKRGKTMKFSVIGRVHPENASVWFDRIERSNGTSRYSIDCKVSQLYVVLESPEIVDLDTAKNVIQNLAETYVNVVGFAFGARYTVEITQVIREDGQVHFYVPKNDHL